MVYFPLGAVFEEGDTAQGQGTPRRYTLRGFPGIGPQRAQKRLRRFGTIAAVLSTEIEELASVKGTGQKAASNIKWLVSESMSGYGSDPFTEHFLRKVFSIGIATLST